MLIGQRIGRAKQGPGGYTTVGFQFRGYFWVNDGEVNYTNGLTIYAAFSEEALKGTGTYYLTLDGLGGTVNGKYEITLKSSSSEYQTVDLTQYVPVREGYTFVGWDLNGRYVTEISLTA